MPAVERDPRQDPAYQARQERRRFAAGLQTLASLTQMGHDFGWAAGQIMGDPDADARIQGMIEFAVAFGQFAHDQVDTTIAEAQGVPVDVHVPPVKYNPDTDRLEREGPLREQAVPGRVVGLVGRNRFSRTPEFYGIAVVSDEVGSEDFAAVSILVDGTTTLIPEHLRPEYQRLPGRDATQAILAKKLAENSMRDGRPRRTR